MKSLLVLCLVFVAVYGLPAKHSEVYDDSDESFFLLPMDRPHQKQVPSVVKVDVGDSDEEDSAFFPSYFRPFFINPFSFMNFGFSDFFSKPAWFDSLVPKGIPDSAVKNATSSTKVVDGHKITVNETTYENEKNGAVYKFQVIEVSPVDPKETEDQDSDEKTNTDVPVSKQPEVDTRINTADELRPDQNSQDNEIHKEEMLASYELQGDDPSLYNNVESVNLGNRPPVDLSGDLRVNALLAENARRGGLFMVPPEVEVFDKLDYDYPAGKYQEQEITQPEFNHQVIKPQTNQQVIQPEFYQRTIQPQSNQQVIQPEFYQRTIQPQSNQQVIQPEFYQRTIQPQSNQQVIQPEFYQRTIQPQYNQQVTQPQYNHDP